MVTRLPAETYEISGFEAIVCSGLELEKNWDILGEKLINITWWNDPKKSKKESFGKEVTRFERDRDGLRPLLNLPPDKKREKSLFNTWKSLENYPLLREIASAVLTL